MKVIKKGREQEGWAIEMDCIGKGNGGGGCGARLLVEQPDVFSTYTRHFDETENYLTFICSECGVNTDIPKFMWPARIEFPDRQAWLVLQKTKNSEKSNT